MTQPLENFIDQGVGRKPADIVLKGGRFFDLVTGELVASDIAICGDRIVGTCGDYIGVLEIDITGRKIDMFESETNMFGSDKERFEEEINLG